MIPTGGRRRVRLGGMPRAKQEITGRSHEPILSTRVLLQTGPSRLGRGRELAISDGMLVALGGRRGERSRARGSEELRFGKIGSDARCLAELGGRRPGSGLRGRRGQRVSRASVSTAVYSTAQNLKMRPRRTTRTVSPRLLPSPSTARA